MESNAVGWFEIAVTDMERAMTFYQTVFGYPLERHQMGPVDMAWFPMNFEGPGAAGALCCNAEFYKPSKEGTTVYINSKSGDLNNELSRVEGAGGQIMVPKTQISPEYGYMAVIFDTEGNRIALHSQN
jgi:hypothetical protein